MKELLKIIVQPVAAERNENGKTIGEILGEPRALYTREEWVEFYDGLAAQIEKENGNGDGPA